MKQIVEISKKLRIEFNNPRQGLKKLEHKFRRLEEYIEYHKLNKPFKQIKRDFCLQACDSRLRKYSIRPSLETMTEEEKRESTQKICELIQNYGKIFNTQVMVPPNLMHLNQMSEKSHEMTFTPKKSQED